MKLEIKLIKGKDTSKRLRKYQRVIRNPIKAHKEIASWLQRWVNQNFDTEGGNVGRWKPFKYGGRLTGERGADGRFTVDESAKLLQDTGLLRASFNHFYSRTTAGIGTDLRYSLTHALGIPHKNVPIRRMLPLATDRSVDARIIQIYDRYFQKERR